MKNLSIHEANSIFRNARMCPSTTYNHLQIVELRSGTISTGDGTVRYHIVQHTYSFARTLLLADRRSYLSCSVAQLPKDTT